MDKDDHVGIVGWMFGVPLAIGVVGVVVGALMIPFVVVDGLVLSVLWGWFVTPVLGWHDLGILQAIGIMLVARLLTSHRTIKDELAEPPADLDRRKLLTYVVQNLIVGPVLVLAFGFGVYVLSGS